MTDMLAAHPDIDAVPICTPPQIGRQSRNNCDAPIQVELDMVTEQGVPIRADCDFLQEN